MDKIYITQLDKDRLMKLLERKKPHDEFDKALLAELNRGEIVDSKDIPFDIVTMNSQVIFTDEFLDEREYWLVFPEAADLKIGRISVLSPIGCALLGYKIGDEVTIPTPQGRKKLTIKEIVHQPEREGNFDL